MITTGSGARDSRGRGIERWCIGGAAVDSERDWLLRLTSMGEVPALLCLPATAAAAQALLGPGPVGWGLQAALGMTQEVIREVPGHGGGRGPVEMLHRSVQASVLTALAGLWGDVQPDTGLVPAETIEGNAELARRGVPLEQVLRGVRDGHARLHQALMTALDAEPEMVRVREAHRVGDLLFAYADTHASRMAQEYVAERDRWQGSTQAARRRIAEDLLAGRPVDPGAAAQTLGYRLDRHHQAFVIWDSDPGTPAEVMHTLATQLASASRSAGWLAIPADRSELWLWTGWTGPPGPALVAGMRDLLAPPPGLQVAAGPVSDGRDGFRRSHRGAQEAARIARTAAVGSGWLWDYAQLRAVTLLTADVEHARWYDTALSGSPAALPSLLAFAQPGHVLFGSDWPFAPDLAVAYFTGNLDAYPGLDDHGRAEIDHAAARLLFPRLA